MGHVVVGTPVLKISHGGMSIVGVGRIWWRIKEVLNEVGRVMEGDDGILGLHGGKHGLPYRKRVKPLEECGKV